MKQLTEVFSRKNLLLPIWFKDDYIQLIDQKKLPFSKEVYTIQSVPELAQAIKEMTIRGSGAIGLCGAYGLYLSARNSLGDANAIREDAELLIRTRPTAVNLVKTVEEIVEVLSDRKEECLYRVENKVKEILKRQLQFEYDLGEYGASLINDGDTILTHCHSGALAGSGYGGRALSVIRKAFEQGKRIHVFVCETRPYLQGARITAYELKQFGIPFTLITDNMSGYCMSQGLINKVVVGSDRVARNGDLANKIGTYMHALVANEHRIPFYTATSSHTIDLQSNSGNDIKVEIRNPDEVIQLNGVPIAPEGTEAFYPSFDITPHHLISGIITENGVISPPYNRNLQLTIGS